MQNEYNIQEITDRLEKGIKELFDSRSYQEYLKVMAKFHRYSLNNTILISMQFPQATHVAGFSAWKINFGRTVCKGEKGIKILAPCPHIVKKEVPLIYPSTQRPVIGADGYAVTEMREITIPSFKVVHVFDISQTEGRELPTLGAKHLEGSVENYRNFYQSLLQTAAVPVTFERLEGGTHGYYYLKDNRIVLGENMSELQTIKTFIHEIAHAKLHSLEQKSEKDRFTKEVEAESVAYTVCRHYGLDTSEYSFHYIAGWSSSKELKELKQSLETIRNTSSQLIEQIDQNLIEHRECQQEKRPSLRSALSQLCERIPPNRETNVREMIR